MQQFLLQSFPANPDPSPALLKALLINGARSLGTIYDFNMQPNAGNEQGWGLVKSHEQPSRFLDQRLSLHVVRGSKPEHRALHRAICQLYFSKNSDPNATNNPVRVSLVWTDPPGNPAAGVALVNDLELTVTDGTRQQYLCRQRFPRRGHFHRSQLSHQSRRRGHDQQRAERLFAAADHPAADRHGHGQPGECQRRHRPRPTRSRRISRWSFRAMTPR